MTKTGSFHDSIVRRSEYGAAAVNHIPDAAVPIASLPSDIVNALADYDILMVPGLDGSGPRHWQSQWERLFAEKDIVVERVVQHDWANPVRAVWHARLADTVSNRRRPVILIAHSLGAVLSAGFHHTAVAGALLVAPADMEQCVAPERVRIKDFVPLPVVSLNFPAILAASRNDKWLSRSRAASLAARWNAELFDAGFSGHIGNESQLEGWPDGLRALRRLLEIMVALPSFSNEAGDSARWSISQ